MEDALKSVSSRQIVIDGLASNMDQISELGATIKDDSAAPNSKYHDNEVNQWLSDIVRSIKGVVPADKINIVKNLLEDECIFELSDIACIRDKLTKNALTGIGIPSGFANRIEAAVVQLLSK
jgi:hypothetical protein